MRTYYIGHKTSQSLILSLLTLKFPVLSASILTLLHLAARRTFPDHLLEYALFL